MSSKHEFESHLVTMNQSYLTNVLKIEYDRYALLVIADAYL